MSDVEQRLRFVESYLRSAEARIKLAEEARRMGAHHIAVRLCQEAVELCLKAALRLFGIEYPKAHDVGPIVRRYSNVFPKWFRKIVPDLVRDSRDLSLNRGPAMYGDEDAEIPPDELYDERDSASAIMKARRALEVCSRLLEERRRELKQQC